MSLTTGTRIGHYEVLAPLGAGGMGEVYQGRDTRLDRVVAIKSLPPALANDVERRSRFDREARLLASLNHPNIAAIYGLEEGDGTPYLVLEFVDGETLAQRLARGALTVRETLEIGGQIAAAVEAAHERGVVHRDLKPGNVMISASGPVKVLDFGLARGGGADMPSTSDLSVTPTIAMTATAAGVILGTAPYMSPEQARGRAADRRADVWAFGCVLFECLAGQPAFAGETVSDVIARILEREPDWSRLPGSTPARLRDLVRRCLTREVADRPRDIGDLRRELAAIAVDLSSGSSVSRTSPSLAVLYFENLARDPESEYFCAGITEDILTDLSKIKGLRVASRNAVGRYRGAPADIPRIAAELGVGTVLEGSVRRAGERVRITAQLINAADGFHLWAERYDRTLQDVFAVQEEIASSIADALRVALTPAESRSLVQDRPRDVHAYDLYLKGREQYGRYTAESIRLALDLFQQAIDVDPEYALAWAGIADGYGQMLQWTIAPDPAEAVRLGLEAARRAIAINPRLAEGHKAEALVLRMSGDYEGERRALARAIEVNPRYCPAIVNQAVDRFCSGNVAGAEEALRRALAIDPQQLFAIAWLGLVTRLTRRLDEAFELMKRLRKFSDDPFYITAAHTMIAWHHVSLGDIDAAAAALRAAEADGSESESLRGFESFIAWRQGRIDEARRRVHDAEHAGRLGIAVIVMVAATALRRGEPEPALRLLSRRSIKDLVPCLARLEPELHPLLDHEPFAPRRWDATLVWPLEAPMIDPVCHALFREVRIESGLPQGSDVRLK
jgi:serine/threonine protein kinase